MIAYVESRYNYELTEPANKRILKGIKMGQEYTVRVHDALQSRL